MENLKHELKELVKKYGREAVQSCLDETAEDGGVHTDGDPTPPVKCPDGKIWNGSACVDDLG